MLKYTAIIAFAGALVYATFDAFSPSSFTTPNLNLVLAIVGLGCAVLSLNEK